jgi:hypothetical protein
MNLRHLFIFLLLVAGAHSACAQAAAARKAVVEILETLGQKSAGREARELAEIGGERGLREVLERAVAEGGEAAGENAVRAVRHHGPSVIPALKHEPHAMLNALSKVPDDVATKAIAEANRSPAVMGKLVKDFGAEALEVSSKHPGVGVQAMNKFGAAGVRAGKELTTDELVTLTRAQGFDALSAADKDLFARLFERNPRQFYNALLVAGGGAAIYITSKTVNDFAAQVFGNGEHAGIIAGPVRFALWSLAAVVVALVALWGMVRLGVLRKTRTAPPA